MTNKATQQTFKTGDICWVKHDDGSISMSHGHLRWRWRGDNNGNGLQYIGNDGWQNDDVIVGHFDDKCKLALRALVGPPPWETQAEQPSSETGGITIEAINKIGDRLCSLSNEAEHGFAELRGLATRLIGERDRAAAMYRDACWDCNDLRTRLEQHVADNASLTARVNQLEASDAQVAQILLTAHGHLNTFGAEPGSIDKRCELAAVAYNRLKAELHTERTTLGRDLADIVSENTRCRDRANEVRKSAEEQNAKLIAENKRLRDKLSELDVLLCQANDIAIRMEAGVDPAPLNLAIANVLEAISAESEAAGVLACPDGEPMHFHHDGCPYCMKANGPEIPNDVKPVSALSTSTSVESKGKDVTGPESASADCIVKLGSSCAGIDRMENALADDRKRFDEHVRRLAKDAINEVLTTVSETFKHYLDEKVHPDDHRISWRIAEQIIKDATGMTGG